jgi:hypothetical protein
MTAPLSRQVYRLSLSVVILPFVIKFIMVVTALSQYGFVSNPRIVIIYAIICDIASAIASFLAFKVIPIYFVKDDIPLIDKEPAMYVVFSTAISLTTTVIVFLFIYVMNAEFLLVIFILPQSLQTFFFAIAALLRDRRKNPDWYWSYEEEEGIPLLFLQKIDTHTKQKKK